MRLASIGIGDAHGLPPQVDFPAGGQPRILLAPVGSAKSRFFELVTAAKERIGAYGIAGSTPWPAERGVARVSVSVSLDDEEREFAASTKETLEAEVLFGTRGPLEGEAHPPGLSALFKRCNDAGVGRFELVPAERSLVGSPPGGGLPGRVQQMLCLSSHVKKYAGLPGQLVDLARDRRSEFETFRRAFDSLSPATKCLGVRRAGERSKLSFQSGRQTVAFEDLGLDEHQYVLFAGLSATLPSKRCILLIDEPELHLSEQAAKDLVAALPRVLGEGHQILVGTRSSKVAEAGAPTHVVRWNH